MATMTELETMDIESQCLQKSTDYGAFTVLSEQRLLEDSGKHVADLVDSMKQHGYRHSCPIAVREILPGRYLIVDGQHRFQAAKNLGIAFYFIIDDDLDIETVRHMARTMRKWSLDDYVTSQVRQGNDDYVRLRRLRMKSGMNWEAFMRGGWADYRAVRIEVIKGKFQLTTRREEQIEEFLSRFEMFKKIFPEGWYHRHFVAACALIFSHPKYSHEQFCDRLEYQSTLLVRCPDTAEYVKLLNRIYNYRSHKENVLDFDAHRRLS
jgi:hypothetical protein